MEKSNQVKIVVIGDSGVGKTCIAQRAVSDQFDIANPATVGGAHFILKVDRDDGSDITFNIWDTAGQDEFRSLVPMYFQNAALAIVVYDITSQITFDHLNDWFVLLRQRADDIDTVLVGNKLDMADERVITFDQGINFSHEVGASTYIETSAKTGENIHELFHQLSQFNFEIDRTCHDCAIQLDQPINDEGENPPEKKKGCCGM